MDEAGKVVVITGASSGIGAALALRLAARGDRVALLARRAEPLAAVAGTAGPGALAVPCDVTNRDAVRAAVATTLERFGRIDVWVNNVGQGITRMPSELTDQDIDLMVRVNITSALYGIQEVLPHFRSRGTGQIINVSSMLGRIPFATFRSAYCGAKHFLNALTATLRAELAASDPGITVSLVSPGVVHTDFGLNAVHGGPDSRAIPGGQSAEEVADVLVDVIDTRRTDVYTRAGASERVAAHYADIGVDP